MIPDFCISLFQGRKRDKCGDVMCCKTHLFFHLFLSSFCTVYQFLESIYAGSSQFGNFMLAGNKHVILAQKIKKTSSRLDENRPENKRRQKLDFRSLAYREALKKPCRATRQVEITILPFLMIAGLTRLFCRVAKPVALRDGCVCVCRGTRRGEKFRKTISFH